jgi:transcriptional antiterminator RfaH
MLHWYLVFTKASGESTADENLRRLGYRVYFPRLIQPTLQRGCRIERIAPLFPRYLFLQLDVGYQSLAPARSTLGVASIVRFGSEYAVIPDRVVNGLIQRSDPESGLHRLSHQPLFQPGAAVHIIAGAFDGLEGIFEREAGKERVLVLLNLLGRHVSVRVPAQFVLPDHVW